MNELIVERVAAAMWQELNDLLAGPTPELWTFDDASPVVRDRYRVMARAAIISMEHPDRQLSGDERCGTLAPALLPSHRTVSKATMIVSLVASAVCLAMWTQGKRTN